MLKAISNHCTDHSSLSGNICASPKGADPTRDEHHQDNLGELIVAWFPNLLAQVHVSWGTRLTNFGIIFLKYFSCLIRKKEAYPQAPHV